MAARSIMFQGTGSDVGKSLVVAGLCRLLTRRGMRVAPFKAQNMSNNAAVTDDGGEIGRAQWLQALACGIKPSVHMNPVLLKPESDRKSQLIVRGKMTHAMGAAEYHDYRAQLMPMILESYRLLAKNADVILVEGAGSPAETNLRANDVANMGFARAANCPVVLIGDIERGGVIASMAGTHLVLSDEDRAMIKGFLINKFRGDAQLFAAGMDEIATRTDWFPLGLIPHYAPLSQLPQEDSLAISARKNSGDGAMKIAIFTTPHMANFDDIDPLAGEPGVELCWLKAGDVIPADVALVILPGSKSTIEDLAFVRAQGWDIDLRAHIRRGGRVLGICGGYQMLGKTLADPYGMEGPPQTVEGLGLLDIDTIFTKEKTVTPWQGKYGELDLEGYEIHVGKSTGADCARPFFVGEGATSADGRVCGSYIHGLFASDAFRKKFLGAPQSDYHYYAEIERILDGWADVLEAAVATEQLLELAAPVT